MKKCLAFALGGGGARGALQVGALRALLEAGLTPDLLVGTSIGAVNAACLALCGVNTTGLDRLEQIWHDAAQADFMTTRFARLSLRIMFGQPNAPASIQASQQMMDFFTTHGLSPDYCFEQVTGVRLAMVGADLNSGETVIYGQDPHQTILEGLLASSALPFWFAPVEKDGRYIIDGGLLSNVPVEPALALGATEIIALSMIENAEAPHNGNRLGQKQHYLIQVLAALNRRHIELEIALAEQQGVPVHHIALKCPTSTALSDFSNHEQLIKNGYGTAKRYLACQRAMEQMAYPGD